MKGFAIFIGILLCAIGNAQTLFNNGAIIYTASNAILTINGGIENNSSTSNGTITHHGTMWVNMSGSNPGTITLNNSSIFQGNGTTHIENDWTNNAVFNPDKSTIDLFSSTATQFIGGTNKTTFHILELNGNGIGTARTKALLRDADVDSLLILNDRVLSTTTFTLHVVHPSVNAISVDTSVFNNEGYVSSISPGVLLRNTNSGGTYLFPVGSSSNNSNRYRAVRIKPSGSTNASFSVRFNSYDADNDNYLRSNNDGTFCASVDTFYHSIKRVSGSVNAAIGIYYNPITDGNWSGIAQFRTGSGIWNNIGTSTIASYSGYNMITSGIFNFTPNDEPFLITEIIPPTPVINCPAICSSGTGIFSASGTTQNYSWTIPSGTLLVSGQGTDSATVNWNSSGSGLVIVSAVSANGCLSAPDTCIVNPTSPPVAAFDTLSSGLFGEVMQFTDQSSGGINWTWLFGDGSSSSLQHPTHTYNGAGTYTVTLIVYGNSGCSDTVYKTVSVRNGISFPNVFTPNGDGVNDVFWIPASGFETFDLKIFNRWGTLIWESQKSNQKWDGRNTTGQLQSDGTYFYVLNCKLFTLAGSKEYIIKSSLTILNGSK